MDREQVGCVAKTHRDAERCVIARLTLSAHVPPLRGPGPARHDPTLEPKAIRRAHLRLDHRAPSRGGWRARIVSGCVNSAFLNISQHFTDHLFSTWVPNSTRCQHFLSSLGPFLGV